MSQLNDQGEVSSLKLDLNELSAVFSHLCLTDFIGAPPFSQTEMLYARLESARKFVGFELVTSDIEGGIVSIIVVSPEVVQGPISQELIFQARSLVCILN
jgi:hypothetical protein